MFYYSIGGPLCIPSKRKERERAARSRESAIKWVHAYKFKQSKKCVCDSKQASAQIQYAAHTIVALFTQILVRNLVE